MYCSRCGAQNADGSSFCGQCGTPLNAGAPMYPPQNQPQSQWQQQYQYPNGSVYIQTKEPRKAPHKAPLVLGIIGILFALILPIITYGCSIPGLIMANSDIRDGLTHKHTYRILNIVALALAALNSFVAVVSALSQYL